MDVDGLIDTVEARGGGWGGFVFGALTVGGGAEGV